jgi:ATP-dependent Lon protease
MVLNYIHNKEREKSMSDNITADKLVKAYIKIRDKRAELSKQDNELEAQQEMIQQELLNICKETGSDGLRTQYGTVSRRIAKKYWTSDWESLYKFIKEHDAFHFLHQRISNLNVDKFLEENPDLHPPGLQADASYTVVVRRK